LLFWREFETGRLEPFRVVMRNCCQHGDTDDGILCRDVVVHRLPRAAIVPPSSIGAGAPGPCVGLQDMPMTRLIYFSRCVLAPAENAVAIDAILATGRGYNSSRSLTSALVTSPDFFLQAIEGRRGEVSMIYSRIITDPRHHSCELVCVGPVDERLFPRWAMLLVNLGGTPPSDVRRFTSGPSFDPRNMSPGMALGFLQVVAALAVAGHSLTVDPDVIPFPG
jgi:hypothetical protein